MTEEELDKLHTAFWAGVDAARSGKDFVEAYYEMVDYLEKEESGL